MDLTLANTEIQCLKLWVIISLHVSSMSLRHQRDWRGSDIPGSKGGPLEVWPKSQKATTPPLHCQFFVSCSETLRIFF